MNSPYPGPNDLHPPEQQPVPGTFPNPVPDTFPGPLPDPVEIPPFDPVPNQPGENVLSMQD